MGCPNCKVVNTYNTWPQHPCTFVVYQPPLSLHFVSSIITVTQINLTTLDAVDSPWNYSKYTFKHCVPLKGICSPKLRHHCGLTKTQSIISMFSVTSDVKVGRVECLTYCTSQWQRTLAHTNMPVCLAHHVSTWCSPFDSLVSAYPSAWAVILKL